MNGRFPFDVFVIIFLPFVIAAPIFFAALLMSDHVRHGQAVIVALAAALVLSVFAFWNRRRRRRSRKHSD
jgi:Flp pilus assembly protein TadB